MPSCTSEPQPVTFGEGEPPEELFGIDNLRHKDQRVRSLINMPLWNECDWRGVAYIIAPNTLPMIAIGFGNIEAGIRIFQGLKARLRDVDKDERLRVSVITGVDKKHPSYYKVLISSNLSTDNSEHLKYVVIVTRVHLMEPPDLINLNNFIKRYEQTGKYVLLPTHFTSANDIEEPIWELGIVKQQFNLREAWQIGEYDPDVAALHETDEPIIPMHVSDAPIIQAMQRIKNLRKRRRH
jgi:hypothetical protein